MFGGEPTLFTRYASAASDDGLTAWVVGEIVVGSELRAGADWEQLLWPGRGLVLHQRDDVIAVALGLAPFTAETWASDPLRRWRIERRTDR